MVHNRLDYKPDVLRARRIFKEIRDEYATLFGSTEIMSAHLPSAHWIWDILTWLEQTNGVTETRTEGDNDVP